MATTYYRDDQTSISATMDGVTYGPWDAWSGGNLDADTVKYRTLQAGEVDLGGPASRGDLTLTVQSNDIVVSAWWANFENAVGKGRISANIKFLDANGAVQVSHTRTGTVKSVTPSDMDRSNTSPGRATFQVVISCDEKGT